MSRWFFIRNHRCSEVEELDGGPWDYEVDPIPKTVVGKPAYRKWCLDPTTDHIFYTAVEGINPHLRVGEDNPPRKIYALVGDYDADIPNFDEVWERVEKQPPEFQPAYICHTFSGGLRIVWLFEEPVWADEPETLKRFLAFLAHKTEVKKLAPGFDDASIKEASFLTWEFGKDWEPNPKGEQSIPARTLRKVYADAVLKATAPREYSKIPLDEVQEQIEAKYPGRLFGHKITEGGRVPCFWLPGGDGKEKDLSAIVAPWGVYAFTSRADKGMMFWDELLPKNFIQDFEEDRFSKATDEIYYDGKAYWMKSPRGKWVSKNKEDMTLDLKVDKKLSSTKDPKKTASEAEQALYLIQTMNRVDVTAPFPWTSDKFIKWNGEEYLNINTKPYMEMSATGTGDPEKFPWLWEFLSNFFSPPEDGETDPVYYFLAELKRAYEARINNWKRSSRCLVIAGPQGRGKSFLATVVLRAIFGSATDAGGFLVDQKSFNKALGESYVWFVDDNKSTSSLVQHKNFSETLKKHIATPEVSYQPKYYDARQIPWYGIIVVGTNSDPESLGILPDMDISIAEKISLFMVSDWQAPFKDNDTMAEIVEKELPFFLRWLMDEFEVPEEIISEDERYGIHPYHHKELRNAAREASPTNRMAEILDLWREKFMPAEDRRKDGWWEGSASALLTELCDPTIPVSALVRTFSPTHFGRQLEALIKLDTYHHLDRVTLEEGETRWKVREWQPGKNGNSEG